MSKRISQEARMLEFFRTAEPAVVKTMFELVKAVFELVKAEILLQTRVGSRTAYLCRCYVRANYPEIYQAITNQAYKDLGIPRYVERPHRSKLDKSIHDALKAIKVKEA